MKKNIIRRIFATVIGTVCASALIEITQLVTERGLCETDDLWHNMLGAIVGCILYCGLCFIIS